MNILKRTGSRFSLYLAGLCFFLAANTFVFFSIVNAGNIKGTLSEEQIYEKFIPAVLSVADDREGDLPLRDPIVEQAAIKAFPASELERVSGTVIDGTFAWLEGDTESPQFAVDLSANKQRLAEELGASAESRAAGLPRCTSIPASVDAFSTGCLPFGVSPASLRQQVTSQYAQDQRFLENPVLKPSSFGLDGPQESAANTEETPEVNLRGLQGWYENRDLLHWLLPILAIVFGSLGIYLATDKRKAMRILSRTLAVGVVGLAVFAIVVNYAIEAAIETLSKDAITRDIVGPILLHMVDQARTGYLIWAGIGAVIALGLFIGNRKLAFTPEKKSLG